MLLISVCTVCFAKYNTSERISSSMEIAKPIFIVEGKETTKISAIQNTGYYEFSVKNYDETNISKTGFLYTIEIVSKTDESIQFQLYKEDKQIELKDLKTEELFITGNEQTEQKYKLKVTYDNTKGNKEKDILEDIQVKIHSEQEKKI